MSCRLVVGARKLASSIAWAKVGKWDGGCYSPQFIILLGEGLTCFLPLQGGQLPPTGSVATGKHSVRASVLQIEAPPPFLWDSGFGWW